MENTARENESGTGASAEAETTAETKPPTKTTLSRALGSRLLRITAGLTVGLGVLWLASAGWNAWSAYAGYLKYEPQEGDVIFQSLPYGPVVLAIEGVTESPYSHCGIVAMRPADSPSASAQWVVYESIGKVRVTPLKQFLFRGRGGGFVVYRLREEHRGNIPRTLICCEAYFGRPYDIRYRLDDEKIYCSELIYKAYRDATNGQQLGDLRRFGEMNWQPYETLIRKIEGGEVPVDREMITPADLAKARQLEPVFSHRLPVEIAESTDGKSMP